MTRRAYPRVPAAAAAATLPLSIISAISAGPALGGEAQPAATQSSGEKSAVPGSQYSGTATIHGPFPTPAEAEADDYVDESKAGWGATSTSPQTARMRTREQPGPPVNATSSWRG